MGTHQSLALSMHRTTFFILKACRLQIVTDASSADLSVPLDEDGCLNFYWFDAFEEPAKPGRIYLFGKVKTGEKVGSIKKKVQQECICQSLIMRRQEGLICTGRDH